MCGILPGDREVAVPRAGWVKPESDQRLSDHVALGVLTRTFPPGLVDAVLAETGRTEQRSRLLPARLMVYYVMGLALFSSSSYEEVMRNLVEGLAWASGWAKAWSVPSKSAIFQARRRLGVEPLQVLFERGCVPLGTPATPGGFYRRWRLVAIDGTTLDVADTAANDEAFGRPGASRGSSAFPQVRLVGLAECGTHAIFGAAIGPYGDAEQSLARGLLGGLGPGMLCLADRGFAGVPLFDAAQATGADLLWRAKSNAVLPVLERFDDGSFRSEIVATPDKRTRTIEDPGRPDTPERYRLITTILDPAAAPAEELAALYAERWEIETALGEVKTHQRGPRVVLRSKTPDGVRQEVYGYLCTHYAIRALMATAADDADVDPDRISFTRTLHAARRSTRAGLGTTDHNLTIALGDTIAEILHELLPLRRLRTAARVVKRKMSNYGVKRAEHRNTPRPTLRPHDAVHVLAPP
jgi:hypothetical protein